jgi:oligoendopeptidase F
VEVVGALPAGMGDWDLADFFPEVLGVAYHKAVRDYREGIDTAVRQASRLKAISLDNLAAWTEVLLAWEKLHADSTHLTSYLSCLRNANSQESSVAQEHASLQALGAEHRKLDVCLLDALRRCSDAEFEALLQREALVTARFRLSRYRESAQKMMSAELETLNADLEVDGLAAWGRLYDQVSGALQFSMPQPDGTSARVPMSMKTSLLESPDAAVRRSTLVNSNRAWEEMEQVVAACLNSIAGTRLTLYRKRGIKHFLEPALFEAGISQKTLDAMMSAIASQYQIPRDFLALKARLLGKTRLGFQDLAAPLPVHSHQGHSWEEAERLLSSEFTRLYPDFGKFTAHAFRAKWIDYQPRVAKRQGGFCTSSDAIAQSRIFMTYNGTLGDVQTLAHELGHAYHHHVMRDLRPLNLLYPMTLAETASTFAENLLTDAILQSPINDETRATMLAQRLDHAAAFMLNIPMRFLFEKRFYSERAEGEVPVARLKELMLEAQRECYGDVLDPGEMDAYFWASKLHFYITDISFYNFPYSFGYLFSQGVYARMREVGPAFFAQYEELLRLTGSQTAEQVARRSLGVDLEQPQFWLDAIGLVAADLDRFRELSGRLFERP